MSEITASTTTAERNGPLAPLRVPGFKVLWLAYSVNELGNWLGDIALAILVFDNTGSALATALLFVGTRFVPALFAPLVVTRVEVLRPRVSLPLLYGADAVVFAGLAALAANGFSLPAVVALGAVDGTLAMAARALTRSTSAALLEPSANLRRGNALFNLGFTLAGALGPAIAGVVTAGAGASTALLADAGSFAFVAVLIAGAGELPSIARDVGARSHRVRAALVYVRQRVLLRGLMVALAFAMIFLCVVIPMEVVYAKETLNAGDSGYGWLLAAWGLGMIIGGFVFAGAPRVPLQLVLALGTLAIGAAYLGLAVAPTLGVACAISVVGGAGNGVVWIACVQAVQEATAPDMQARMLSLVEAIAAAMSVVGFAVGGALTTLESPRTAYTVAGLGVLVVLLIALERLRSAEWPARDTSVRAPEDPAAALGHGPAAG